jgi:hypothetical protein
VTADGGDVVLPWSVARRDGDWGLVKVPVADVTSNNLSTVSTYTSTASASPKPLALTVISVPGGPDVADKVTVAAAAELTCSRVSSTAADPKPIIR